MPGHYVLAGFFTLAFLLVAGLAGVFLAAGLALLAFFTVAFLATGFFAGAFLAGDFLAAGFFAGSPFAALAISNSKASSRVSDSGSMLLGRVARSLPCCTYGP